MLSWQLTRRDWRAGELGLMVLALVVAVAALASVGLVADRMRSALNLQARQLMGADLVVTDSRSNQPAFETRALELGLSLARTVSFPSMVSAGAAPVLASVKAVSPNYPLRGALRVTSARGVPDVAADRAPAAGEVWVDDQLLQTLGLSVGGFLQVGELKLRVARIITLEPDRGANFANFAPRVLIALDDLGPSRLIQPASRANWRLLVSGEQSAVDRYEVWARERLSGAQRIETLQAGRPELETTVRRAEQFLSLVALLTAFIAAVAIALGARRFAQRHLDACAVMRSMGLSQARLLRLLLLELLFIGLIAGAVGIALGAALHQLLLTVLGPLVNVTLPAPSWRPVAQGTLAALVLLGGFGAWPLLRLSNVPPIRVLRRDLGSVSGSGWAAALVAIAAFAGLLFAMAGDARMAGIAIAGFAGGTVAFVLCSALAVRVLAPLRHSSLVASAPAIRVAFASWSRRSSLTIVQTSSLAVGLMALLLVTVTQTDLVEGWRRASPPDAPNRFLINIQPDQREPVLAALQRQGVRADIQPMVRGRLVRVNGEDASQRGIDGDRARRLIEREFNLSYSSELPEQNTLVAGRWFDREAAEVSVERGILNTLDLKLGDTLDFDIAGEIVAVKITSVRKLSWDSMRVNFFMILSPGILEQQPRTFITAYHQPSEASGETAEQILIREFPNLTIFDTSNLIRQVQSLLGQVVRAIQLLFMLTIAAGLVVLAGALLTSRDERMREASLMRALGASSRQLGAAQAIELTLIGALAGFLAAGGAAAVGWAIAHWVFQFDYQVRWSVPILSAAAGAAMALVAGWASLRGVLRSSPLASLRAA
jgi:putative ABC transport system permease protein